MNTHGVMCRSYTSLRIVILICANDKVNTLVLNLKKMNGDHNKCVYKMYFSCKSIIIYYFKVDLICTYSKILYFCLSMEWTRYF